MNPSDEEKLLQSTALQNANSVFLARQRAEQELIRTKEVLQARTDELVASLARMEETLQERDRARSDADEARRIAQEANEAKGRFLRMISHELRTPLGAIGGYAALIEEGIHGPLTDKQRESVARIRHNQQHLLGLVNELLDLARIESGRVSLNLERLLFQSVIESVRHMIEPQIAAKSQHLDVQSDDPDLVVRADRERVEQIVLNLLSNAVKFTGQGGTITISTTHSGDKVYLHVQDTGIGIPADKLEAVFESFVQIEPALSHTRGSGLGLAISRQLARAMHGDLTVESVLGTGSTFTLCLPRATDSTALT
ncbi:MAG: HAMP domain-containing sensor histidine kinase [Gemmatimonadota bacterium]